VNDLIDIVIVGGGPAGLAAALYGARARAKTIVFEKALPGGQIAITDWIENYPGFGEGMSGADLGERMREHAEKFGAEFRTFESVQSVRADGGGFVLTADGAEYGARSVILATGTTPRKLDIPGEAEFTGRGVSWCATCDGPLFRDREVAIIGGGDAAVEEALFLTKFCSKVHIIHRREELRATKCIQERCFANGKVEVHWNRVPVEVIGEEGRVKGVMLASTVGEAQEFLPVAGVFIFVGLHPNSELAKGLCQLSPSGYIIIEHSGMTTVPGLFAAGDVTDYPLKQVVTAAAQGATAAFEAERWIGSNVCTL
jgi:thioredoxin reductase (NADPH)